MLSVYPIMEALSPEGKARLKKSAIGTGFIAAGAETVGKVGQKINTNKVNLKIREVPHGPRDNETWRQASKFINDKEEKAEAFRKIRPTQIIKSAIDKYQDNK
jgi:hypothetical protein